MKRIFISGASSGIGEACVRKFVSEGHQVLGVARREDKLKALQSDLGPHQGNFSYAVLDVNDGHQVRLVVEQHEKFFSNVDVLLNNAGLAIGRESFQESSWDDIHRVVTTNVLGLLSVTRFVLPFMIKRQTGHVINMGSVAGREAYASGAVYCATKAAVHMLTDALRLDVGGTGVRVTTIAPGRVAETEFSRVRFRGDETKAKSVYEGYRVLTADDVAGVVSYVMGLPEHINVQELVILPTDQPSATTLAPLKVKT